MTSTQEDTNTRGLENVVDTDSRLKESGSAGELRGHVEKSSIDTKETQRFGQTDFDAQERLAEKCNKSDQNADKVSSYGESKESHMDSSTEGQLGPWFDKGDQREGSEVDQTKDKLSEEEMGSYLYRREHSEISLLDVHSKDDVPKWSIEAMVSSMNASLTSNLGDDSVQGTNKSVHKQMSEKEDSSANIEVVDMDISNQDSSWNIDDSEGDKSWVHDVLKASKEMSIPEENKTINKPVTCAPDVKNVGGASTCKESKNDAEILGDGVSINPSIETNRESRAGTSDGITGNFQVNRWELDEDQMVTVSRDFKKDLKEIRAIQLSEAQSVEMERKDNAKDWEILALSEDLTIYSKINWETKDTHRREDDLEITEIEEKMEFVEDKSHSGELEDDDGTLGPCSIQLKNLDDKSRRDEKRGSDSMVIQLDRGDQAKGGKNVERITCVKEAESVQGTNQNQKEATIKMIVNLEGTCNEINIIQHHISSEQKLERETGSNTMEYNVERDDSAMDVQEDDAGELMEDTFNLTKEDSYMLDANETVKQYDKKAHIRLSGSGQRVDTERESASTKVAEVEVNTEPKFGYDKTAEKNTTDSSSPDTGSDSSAYATMEVTTMHDSIDGLQDSNPISKDPQVTATHVTSIVGICTDTEMIAVRGPSTANTDTEATTVHDPVAHTDNVTTMQDSNETSAHHQVMTSTMDKDIEMTAVTTLTDVRETTVPDSIAHAGTEVTTMQNSKSTSADPQVAHVTMTVGSDVEKTGSTAQTGTEVTVMQDFNTTSTDPSAHDTSTAVTDTGVATIPDYSTASTDPQVKTVYESSTYSEAGMTTTHDSRASDGDVIPVDNPNRKTRAMDIQQDRNLMMQNNNDKGMAPIKDENQVSAFTMASTEMELDDEKMQSEEESIGNFPYSYKKGEGTMTDSSAYEDAATNIEQESSVYEDAVNQIGNNIVIDAQNDQASNRELKGSVGRLAEEIERIQLNKQEDEENHQKPYTAEKKDDERVHTSGEHAAVPVFEQGRNAEYAGEDCMSQTDENRMNVQDTESNNKESLDQNSPNSVANPSENTSSQSIRSITFMDGNEGNMSVEEFESIAEDKSPEVMQSNRDVMSEDRYPVVQDRRSSTQTTSSLGSKVVLADLKVTVKATAAGDINIDQVELGQRCTSSQMDKSTQKDIEEGEEEEEEESTTHDESNNSDTSSQDQGIFNSQHHVSSSESSSQTDSNEEDNTMVNHRRPTISSNIQDYISSSGSSSQRDSIEEMVIVNHRRPTISSNFQDHVSGTGSSSLTDSNEDITMVNHRRLTVYSNIQDHVSGSGSSSQTDSNEDISIVNHRRPSNPSRRQNGSSSSSSQEFNTQHLSSIPEGVSEDSEDSDD